MKNLRITQTQRLPLYGNNVIDHIPQLLFYPLKQLANLLTVRKNEEDDFVGGDRCRFHVHIRAHFRNTIENLLKT